MLSPVHIGAQHDTRITSAASANHEQDVVPVTAERPATSSTTTAMAPETAIVTPGPAVSTNGAEMPDVATTFTSCSCSHSRRPPVSTQPVSRPLQPNAKEYASALAGTIKAAQVVHARMEQCREWANVVAVAARDAEHADHPLIPYTKITGPSSATHREHALNGHVISAEKGANTLQGTARLQAKEEVPDVYPPMAPAKWYDDPVADARSQSASRPNSPPKAAAAAPRAGQPGALSPVSSLAASARISIPTASVSHRRPSASALTAMHGSNKRSASSDSIGDDDEPLPKRRSAPASPAQAFSLRSIPSGPSAAPHAPLFGQRPLSNPEITRPRPLLTGTIASRTGPALAQVRAAFASVGVECPESTPSTTSSSTSRRPPPR